VPPRAGNRQAGLSSAPYNAFVTLDGYVVVHVVTEAHWQNLLKAMGREDLKDDPRFVTNPARTANMAETEALVTAWTSVQNKDAVVAAAKRYRIPAAPVRNAIEVMNDPHMHERGMLQRVDHPSLGEVVLPSSPLRLHGADRVDPVPSPGLGEHNVAIYGEWLGLGTDAVEGLKRDGVI
jgi:CoA:oxalate CoA-transferase